MAQYIDASSPDPRPEDGDSSPASVVIDLTDERAESPAVSPATTVVDWPTPASDERGSVGKRNRDAAIEDELDAAMRREGFSLGSKRPKHVNARTKLRGALLCSYAQDARKGTRGFVIDRGHECFNGTPITITCTVSDIKVVCTNGEFVRLFVSDEKFGLETNGAKNYEFDRTLDALDADMVDFAHNGFESLSLTADFLESELIAMPEFMNVFDKVKGEVLIRAADHPTKQKFVPLDELYKGYVLTPSWTGWAADQLGLYPPLSAFEDDNTKKYHRFYDKAQGCWREVEINADKMVSEIEQKLKRVAGEKHDIEASIRCVDTSICTKVLAATRPPDARGLMHAMVDYNNLRRSVAAYADKGIITPQDGLKMIRSEIMFKCSCTKKAASGGILETGFYKVTLAPFKDGTVSNVRVRHGNTTTTLDDGKYRPDLIVRLMAMKPKQSLTVECIKSADIASFLDEVAFGCLTLPAVLRAADTTPFIAKGCFTAVADAINRAMIGKDTSVFTLLNTLCSTDSTFVTKTSKGYTVRVPERPGKTALISTGIVVKIPMFTLEGTMVTMSYDENYDAAVPSKILALALLDAERIIDTHMGESGRTPNQVLTPGPANTFRLGDFNEKQQVARFRRALDKIPTELKAAYLQMCLTLDNRTLFWKPEDGGWEYQMLIAALQTADEGVWFVPMSRGGDHAQDAGTRLVDMETRVKSVAVGANGGLVVMHLKIRNSSVLINEIKSQIKGVAERICNDTPGAVVYGGFLEILEHAIAFTICETTGNAVTCNSYGKSFAFGPEYEFENDHVFAVTLLVFMPPPTNGPVLLGILPGSTLPDDGEETPLLPEGIKVYLFGNDEVEDRWQYQHLFRKHFGAVTDARTHANIRGYLLDLYRTIRSSPESRELWEKDHGGSLGTRKGFIARVVAANSFTFKVDVDPEEDDSLLSEWVVKVNLQSLLDRKFEHDPLISVQDTPAYYKAIKAEHVYDLSDNRCSPGFLIQAGGSCWFAAAMTLLARCGQPLSEKHNVSKVILLYATTVYNCSYQIESARSADRKYFERVVGGPVPWNLQAAFADLAC